MSRPTNVTLSRSVTAEEIATFERDGVVKLAGILPPEWVAFFQSALAEVFDRRDADSAGMRTDFSAAALEMRAQGDALLEEGGGVNENARFLSEIEAGRWHEGLRDFEHNGPLVEVGRPAIQHTWLVLMRLCRQVVSQLLQSEALQFYQVPRRC